MSWHHLTAFIQQQVEDCTFRELCLEHVTKQSDTELKQCATMRYHALPCATMRFHALPCATMRYHALPHPQSLVKTCTNHPKLCIAKFTMVMEGQNMPELPNPNPDKAWQGSGSPFSKEFLLMNLILSLSPSSAVLFLPVSTTDLVRSTPIMESTPARRTKARMPPPLLLFNSTPFIPGPTWALWASSKVEDAAPMSICFPITSSHTPCSGPL